MSSPATEYSTTSTQMIRSSVAPSRLVGRIGSGVWVSVSFRIFHDHALHLYSGVFAHAVPRVWNSLPHTITDDLSISAPVFFRAMLCISAAYAVMHSRLRRQKSRFCVCVCVSVTFVDCVKTNKHIFEFFSPSGSHTILVFPYQTGWRYSDGNASNGDVECRLGRQKSRF